MMHSMRLAASNFLLEAMIWGYSRWTLVTERPRRVDAWREGWLSAWEARETERAAFLGKICAFLGALALALWIVLSPAAARPVTTMEEADRAEALVVAAANAGVLSQACERDASGFARAMREMALEVMTELLGSRERAVLNFSRAASGPVTRHFDAVTCMQLLGETRDRIEVERAKYREGTR